MGFQPESEPPCPPASVVLPWSGEGKTQTWLLCLSTGSRCSATFAWLSFILAVTWQHHFPSAQVRR